MLRNFGPVDRRHDNHLVQDETPLALELAGERFALEPGRDYLLGSAAQCDLRLAADAAGLHARLAVTAGGVVLEDLGSPAGSMRNSERVAAATALAPGDVLQFGAVRALLVRDDGSARIVPIPALRLAARERRYAAIRVAAVEALRGRLSFRELVLEELRHAPWFAISLAGHLLLLLLLWLLLPERGPKALGPAEVHIAFADGMGQLGKVAPTVPEVVVEPADAEPDPSEQPPAVTIVLPPPPLPGAIPRDNPRIVRRSSSGTRGAAADPVRGGSPEFRQQVAELRRTGLEIVFVFDSTGSMTRTIVATKNSITQMLTVLRMLVPDAGIGLVTYRDRGARDAYDVRTLPLGRDFCQAINFVGIVIADGGGDRPEDVFGGLHAAFAQPWRAGARRVVVLAGDAPPHAEDEERLRREIRAFAADGRSFVHTLVTSPDLAGDDTHAAFAQIAGDGRGQCLDLEDHERILTDVLQLAIGRQFAADLGAVVRAADLGNGQTDTASLDLARRGGTDLVHALQQNPVPLPLLAGLARLPHRNPTLDLIDLLAAPATPPHTCHAIAWVLQRTLHLSVPPVDPLLGTRPDQPDLERLRQLARRLPD